MTADRPSLNRAFREIGLTFQWDERDWALLSALPDLDAQLRWWLPRNHAHLLKVYEIEFLTRLVRERLAAPGREPTALESLSVN